MARQSEFVVPREVVTDLLDGFLRSRKGREERWCVTFPAIRDDLRAALLRACEGQTVVDYGVISRVLDGFECNKLAANCNSWTAPMRQRLRDAKVRRLQTETTP